MSKRGDPCVIVNDRNEYFERWCYAYAPRYEGDDDHFVRVPTWTKDPKQAYVYSSPWTANASKVWFGAVVAYSECEPVHAEDDHGAR